MQGPQVRALTAAPARKEVNIFRDGTITLDKVSVKVDGSSTEVAVTDIKSADSRLEAIRLFLLSHHYRTPVDFTDQALKTAESGLDKIYALLERCEKYLGSLPDLEGQGALGDAGQSWPAFCEAMNDDFNTAQGIGVLYDAVRNLNRLLAWGHARAIENVLERVPAGKAVTDQFGDEKFVRSALLQKGREIELVQMPRAEEDPAVAAASILARAEFLTRLRALAREVGADLPKGASALVEAAAVRLVKAKGPEVLERVAKTHFKTTVRVLAAAGVSRLV